MRSQQCLQHVIMFQEQKKNNNITVNSDAISGATNLTGSEEIMLKDVDASVVHDSLKKIGIYFVATVEKDRPRLRPIANINLHEGKIWFFCG